MKRTRGRDASCPGVRVLSSPAAGLVALVEPARDAAALARSADVTLDAGIEEGGADVHVEPAVGMAATPAEGTLVSWSEPDEWLEAS